MKNNLKSLRKKKGLTQRQVAELLNLKCEDRLSKWEHGTLYPHVRNAIRLSEIYGVPVDELFQAELPPSPD